MRSRHALYGDYQTAVDNFERSRDRAAAELRVVQAKAMPGISTPPEIEARIAAFYEAAANLSLSLYLRESVIRRMKGTN